MNQTAQTYLKELCVNIPTRRVGSAGNHRATDFFAETIRRFGFETECPEFECIDWVCDEVQLIVADQPLNVFASPYGPGGQARAELVALSTVEALEAADIAGKTVLLHGEIAGEQLMPKHFDFFNPEHHQRIIRLLEEKQPAAIIGATGRNPGLSGGLYPFPLIEDGDFDIPSVYMTEEEGTRLLEYVGQTARLDIQARRIPATGCNVIARKGPDSARRLVVCAHIDAKIDTPGAIDNAAGVIALLLLAERLESYTGPLRVEIVAFNGEDYYLAAGQKQYLRDNLGEDIMLAINIDAAGYHQGASVYSLYGCPTEMNRTIRRVFAAHPDIAEGEAWYQSDHSLFIQQGIPAAALTSERLWELSTHITHTPQDKPEIVDTAKLVKIAHALEEVVLALGK